jgi:hypothetical protein
MALTIQSIMPDLAQKRATINLTDIQAGESIAVAFHLPQLTGDEKLSEAQNIAKQKAKHLLQTAIGLL